MLSCWCRRVMTATWSFSMICMMYVMMVDASSSGHFEFVSGHFDKAQNLCSLQPPRARDATTMARASWLKKERGQKPKGLL